MLSRSEVETLRATADALQVAGRDRLAAAVRSIAATHGPVSTRDSSCTCRNSWPDPDCPEHGA
jgi:hypothetical protein